MKNSIVLILCVSLSGFLYAESKDEFEFNPKFIYGNSQNSIDISKFNKAGYIVPGVYPLEIYVNGVWIGRENIKIDEEISSDNGSSKICFTKEQVFKLDVNWEAIPGGDVFESQTSDNAECLDILKIIPGAQVGVSSNELTLNLTIPQAYSIRTSRGFVSPEKWTGGVNAGFVKYRLNTYRSSYKGSTGFNSQFAFLETGVNLKDWRLRHNGVYTKSSGNKGGYSSQSTYLQRDVVPFSSRVTIGQYFTQGYVFDNIPYTGVAIGSDDRMLPESMQGFAPVITGTADSNAQVVVYQNNQQIFETTVPPGPFIIDDLYNTGYNGDLEVVVTEADGRVKRFTVPYSNIVQLLRPGTYRYSLVGGRYRNSSYSYSPNFVEATFQRGLTNLMTAYAGVRLSKNYHSEVLGVALNTPIGAVAGDVTFSNAKNLPNSFLNEGGSSSGTSYRITLNKLIAATNTNLVLGAYKYSNRGFLGFQDFVRAKDPFFVDNVIGGVGFSGIYPQRERFQIYLSQRISDRSSIYLNGTTESYWGSDESRSSNYQIGYTHSFVSGIGMELSYSMYKNKKFERPDQFYANFSIPLERDGYFDRVGVSAASNSDGNNYFFLNASGSFKENQGNYSFYTDYQDSSNKATVGANLQLDSDLAQFNAGFSAQGQQSSQINASMSGGIVFHEGGLNFARSLGDTFGIVHAEGAAGARLNGDFGGVIERNNYGIVGNLSPYRSNNIWLDSEGVDDDVEVTGGSFYVAPTAGAIISHEFKTITGKASLLKLMLNDQTRPPMGAEVRDMSTQKVISQVGQGGQIYLRGFNGGGKFSVEWGSKLADQCTFELMAADVDSYSKESAFNLQHIQCSSK